MTYNSKIIHFEIITSILDKYYLYCACGMWHKAFIVFLVKV